MTTEQDYGQTRIEQRSFEVKLRGLEKLDPLTGRLVAVGLLMYEALRHPLRDSVVTVDFSRRTVSVTRN